MKKNYIVPAIIISEVDTNTLLVGSFGDDVNNKTPVNDKADNQFSKKHYSVWGDDEE